MLVRRYTKTVRDTQISEVYFNSYDFEVSVDYKMDEAICNHEHLPSNIYVFWVRRYAKTVRDVKI